MTDQPQQDKSQKDLEEEVWTAISAFEQILQAIPKDRGSLEVLSHAYEQIGDHTRARDYTIRLAEVLLEEGDAGAVSDALERVRAHAAEDDSLQELVNRMEAFAGKGEAAAQEPEPSAGDKDAAGERNAPPLDFDISTELSFAWSLLEDNMLTQEEYSAVVQDLSEMSASESGGTVSVMHVLEARGFRGLPRLMAHVAKKYDTPIIALSSFEFQIDTMRLLPAGFVEKRGAAIFEVMGGDALVAILNPVDHKLRQDVQKAANRKCHFYLTTPQEFDHAVSQLKTALEESPRKKD